MISVPNSVLAATSGIRIGGWSSASAKLLDDRLAQIIHRDTLTAVMKTAFQKLVTRVVDHIRECVGPV